MKMGTIYLKLLSSSFFILTVVTALLRTYPDHGNCESASSNDRLSINVTEPKVYEVQLILRPTFDLFTGTCDILVQVHQQTRTISLHAYKIRANLGEIQLIPVNETVGVKPVEYRYCKVSQILDLHFNEDIVPAHYYLKFPLTVEMTIRKFEGLLKYRHIRKLENYDQGWLLGNLFQPNMARNIFPCWDQPEIKAHFNISIGHPSEYTVLSNMPIAKVLHNKLNYTYFEVSPLMSPSKVAIVMFDTLHEAKMHGMSCSRGKKIIWNRPQKITKLHYFCTTIDTVRFFLFKHVLGQTNIPKMNYIVAPNSLMKVTGLANFSIYREEDVIYSSKLHFPGRRLQILKLLAHQEVRQWFDQTVISSSSSNIFRESFATYFTYYYCPSEIDDDTQLQDLFTVQVLQPILHYDIVLQMKPVIHDVNETDEIDKYLFSRLYGYKGAVILFMLENILTPNVLHQRISQSKQKWKNDPNERNKFWDMLQYNDDEEQIHNISNIMTWLRQKKFPELFILQDYKTVIITAVCDQAAKWNISLNIYTVTNLGLWNIVNNTLVECHGILNNTVSDVNFVMVNLYQFGYYRVNYDDIGWGRISRYLQYGNYELIPVQNRAQLIDDAYYYVVNYKIPPSVLCNLISYLKRETHYIPWYTMFNILTYLSTYKFRRSKTIELVVLDSLDGLLQNIGYEEHAKDDEMTISLRLLATRWACKLGHTECQKAATKKLFWILFTSDKINLPWWKDWWVYCMGIKRVTSVIWHSMFSVFLREKNINAIKHLACTDDDKLLVHYIHTLINDTRVISLFRNKELVEHFRTILQKNVKKSAVLDYVLQNFNYIGERIYKMNKSTSLWGDIILNVDQKQITRIEEFGWYIFKEWSENNNEIKQFLNAWLRQMSKEDPLTF